jgi:hypothetical protein
LNHELYDQIKRELAPIFNKFYKTSPSYRKFLESGEQLSSRLSRNNLIAKDLTELQKFVYSKDVPLKYHTLMTAFAYLLRLEVLTTFFVDLTLLLIIDERICLHLDPDDTHKFVRHASSLEDIESPSLPLSRKLDFLETHNVTIFKDYIDRDLRNKIAHGNFLVDNDGNFCLISKKGNVMKKDLKQVIMKLTDFTGTISQVYFDEFIRSSALPERPNQ